MAELKKYRVHIEKVFFLQAVAEIEATDEEDARNIVRTANDNQELELHLDFDFQDDISPIEADDDEVPESWDDINLNIIDVTEVVEPDAQEFAELTGGKVVGKNVVQLPDGTKAMVV